uniref:NADH-ubiquinone oxidoreductase chain 6 n=1 Tax=Satanas sp. KW-2016 TaxID=1812712 RepID=A0A164R3P3_9MUSC|nr:NADH dehydrogenase subunit 6 [Satanas sp. KW-2016]
MTMSIMTLLTLLSTMVFLQTSHPLAMGLTLLVQTTMISLMAGMVEKTFWFSYILFMVFLGGMLVLFIYVAALASNEIFSLSMTMLMMYSAFTLIAAMMIMVSDLYMSHPASYTEFMPTSWLKSFYPENSLSLIKLYNPPTNYTTIMLMSYLLITLIAVVKVTNVFEGPLRKIN